jgi:hypothetical protein
MAHVDDPIEPRPKQIPLFAVMPLLRTHRESPSSPPHAMMRITPKLQDQIARKPRPARPKLAKT